MVSLFRLAALVVVALAAMPAWSQSPAPAGEFDYYLLTLSWSPEFCASHAADPSAQEECSQRRGLVVHGLWPQNQDGGWRAFCRPVSTVPVALAKRELAVMPNVDLIEHEWTKHGSCTTYSAPQYFDALNHAFAAIHVPESLTHPATPIVLPLAEAKQQWATANPCLDPNMISFQCSHAAAHRNEVQEIRICLDKGLGLRPCGAGQVDICPAEVKFVPASP